MNHIETWRATLDYKPRYLDMETMWALLASGLIAAVGAAVVAILLIVHRRGNRIELEGKKVSHQRTFYAVCVKLTCLTRIPGHSH